MNAPDVVAVYLWAFNLKIIKLVSTIYFFLNKLVQNINIWICYKAYSADRLFNYDIGHAHA